MNMYKITCVILILCIITGCVPSEKDTTEETEAVSTAVAESNSIVTYDAFDYDEDYRDEDCENITFSENGIAYSGSHAKVSDNQIEITTAGTYIIQGNASDARIVVNATKDDQVHIVLNNLTLTCTTTSPFYIKQAKKVVITLATDTKNTLSDTSNYTFVANEDEPDATLFAKDDLTINGTGELQVEANYKAGIKGKDDVKIMNGNLHVTSIDNGIQGKDLLAIKNGTIQIQAIGDGIKATNAEESDKGIVCIEGGRISIDAQQDAIQSDNLLYIYDGSFEIISGGGSANAQEKVNMDMFHAPFDSQTTNSEEDTISCKGIKASNAIQISGGTFTIDSADDTLHTNGTLDIQGGTFTLTSGDDGIHADIDIHITQGTIAILECYEGIEASNITITDGNIHIKASDDGVNASTSVMEESGKAPGQGDASALTIQGGYIYVDANGDGLDSNGSIAMHGGMVIVNGPVDGGNGSLDFDGSFTIDGGTLIAAGSSNMLQTPTTIENGNCLAINFTATTSLMHIEDQNGTSILTFQPTKSAQSLIYYTSSLQTNSTYHIYMNGSIDGTNTDGVYEGTYTDGVKMQEVSIEDTLTTVGNFQTNMGGMRGGGKPNNLMP